MEMRTIIPHLLRKFDFSLTKEYADLDEAANDAADSKQILRKSPSDPLPTNIDSYGGTMGPRDLSPEAMAGAEERLAEGSRPKLGMWLHATPRETRSRSNL